jgi:hypothetical protein
LHNSPEIQFARSAAIAQPVRPRLDTQASAAYFCCPNTLT